MTLDENESEDVFVSATDVRRLQECPLQLWYAFHNPSETAAPSLALAMGQIEHEVRAMLWPTLQQRYVTGILDEAEEEKAILHAVGAYFAGHPWVSVFGKAAANAQNELQVRLIGESNERISNARALRAANASDVAIAEKLLPIAVEVRLEDPELGLVGVVDEVWQDKGELFPVELKTSPATPTLAKGSRMQAITYAVLMERVWGRRVRRAVVRHLRDGLTKSYVVSQRARHRVEGEATRVRRLRQSVSAPQARPSRETCDYCPFQVGCPESILHRAEGMPIG